MNAVVLMAYGTPRTTQDIEGYYTHIRGGKPPTSIELENLAARYAAIGGTSPLLRITEGQRDKLQSRLEAAGSKTRVYSAMKHAPPFISDVVKEAADGGADRLLSIALAPHYSRISIGSYIKTVEDANANLDGGKKKKMKLSFVRSWHDHPRLIQAWSERVVEAGRSDGSSSKKEGASEGQPWLIFSAHSLPARILSEGDPYLDELLKTSQLVAAASGRTRWSFSFQSSSHTHEPWLGPDILENLGSLQAGGETRFLIAPIGFVSDHLEILYDIDVEAKQWAKDHGVVLERCESLNNSERLIECLYELVKQEDFL